MKQLQHIECSSKARRIAEEYFLDILKQQVRKDKNKPKRKQIKEKKNETWKILLS